MPVTVRIDGLGKLLDQQFSRLHRTYRLPSRFVASGPVRFVPVARAVADTVRMLGDVRDVRAVVADAVQRGRCTVAGLAVELNFSPRQIRREPAEVVRLIKDTLERGFQRPPLPIRTIPCPESPGGARGAGRGARNSMNVAA